MPWSAVPAVAGALLSSNASKKAAESQSRAAQAAGLQSSTAANSANDTQRYMYDTSRNDLSPYRDTGTNALNQLNQMMGLPTVSAASSAGGGAFGVNDLSPEDQQKYWAAQSAYNQHNALAMGIGNERLRDVPNQQLWAQQAQSQMDQILANAKKTRDAQAATAAPGGAPGAQTPYSFQSSDPSYKWRLDQGQQALERSKASRGMSGSGNTLAALMDYGQGAASQEYGAQYNRLASMAGIGQTATNSGIQAGQNFANQTGQNSMNAAANTGNAGMAGANAQASGQIGSANAWGTALGSVPWDKVVTAVKSW